MREKREGSILTAIQGKNLSKNCAISNSARYLRKSCGLHSKITELADFIASNISCHSALTERYTSFNKEKW